MWQHNKPQPKVRVQGPLRECCLIWSGVSGQTLLLHAIRIRFYCTVRVSGVEVIINKIKNQNMPQ